MSRTLSTAAALSVAGCTSVPAFELNLDVLVDPLQDPLADAHTVRILLHYPGGVVEERTVDPHGGDALIEDLPEGEGVVVVMQGIGRELDREVVVALGRSAPLSLGPDGASGAIFVARPDSLSRLPFDLVEPRAFAQAVWTPGDRVLVIGGGDWDDDSVNAVELLGADPLRPYAPATESVGELDRIGHNARWIGERGGGWDNRVAVFGGTTGAGTDTLAGGWENGTAAIDLIDPLTGAIEAGAASLPVPLMDSRIVETDQGLLALVGGYFTADAEASYADRIYLCDPSELEPGCEGEPTVQAREQHEVTSLPGQLDARFLITGGFRSGTGLDGSAAVWSGAPAVGAESLGAGVMALPRARHRATTLGSGRVLITGGSTGTSSTTSPGTPLSSAEVFDPAGMEFTQLPASMIVARQRHVATVIPGDRVLLCGGQGADAAALASCEVYQAGTGIFEPFDGVLDPGGPGTAVVEYPDGRRLFVGGAELPGAPGGGLTLYMPPAFVD